MNNVETKKKYFSVFVMSRAFTLPKDKTVKSCEDKGNKSRVSLF